MTPWLRKFIVAAFVVFLHYVPQITVWMDQSERYCDWWSRRLRAVDLAGHGGLGGRRGRRRLARLAARPAVADAVVQPPLPPLAHQRSAAAVVPPAEENAHLVDAVWVVAVAAIVGSLLWRRSPLVRWAAVARPTPAAGADPLRADASLAKLGRVDGPAAAAANVAAGGRSRRRAGLLLRLRRMVVAPQHGRRPMARLFSQCPPAVREQAVLFRHALSPFRETMQSLPRVIYQTDRRFAIRNGRTYFENGRATPMVQAPSLFQAARREGGRDDPAGILPSLPPRPRATGRLLPLLFSRRRGARGPLRALVDSAGKCPLLDRSAEPGVRHGDARRGGRGVPSALGLNAAYLRPRKPGSPTMAHVLVFIFGDRPTNGGTSGRVGPCTLLTVLPSDGQPPLGCCFCVRPCMH